jgi:hypothetical protein
MTPQELAEIDRKVAEAIGLNFTSEYNWCASYDPLPHNIETSGTDKDGRSVYAFTPSRDWSDAMFAAEKAGLWPMGHIFGKESYCQENKYYVSSGGSHGEYGYNPIARHESGPLCISKAILHLKGKE